MRFLSFSVLALCTMVLPTQAQTDVKDFLSALADPPTTADAASRLIALSHSKPNVRRVVDQELPAMLLHGKNIPVVQSEARVAGALRLESTIPSLIQLLSWYNGAGNETMTSSHQLWTDPVARALYEIGTPAEPALTEALESKNRLTRERVAAILILRNTPKTRSLLRNHLAAEPDAQLKIYIQGNLDWMERHPDARAVPHG